MKKLIGVMLFVAIMLGLATGDLWARGGGGGGARGGGVARGGMGGGGNRGGGMAAPRPAPRPAASPSINRSPSMSRVSPSSGVSRPATAASRPTQLPAGGVSRPSAIPGISAGARSAAGQVARTGNIGPAGGYAAASQRPTQSQLNSFLNMPAQTGAGARRAAPPTASQLPSTGQGIQSKTVTTPGGSTITVAGGTGSRTTQGGATVGGASAGIKVEGAGGNTYVKGSGVAGASKGDTSVVAGGSRTGVETASGAKAVSGRGVVGGSSGSNAAVAGRSAAGVQTAAGNKAANVRAGYADTSGFRQAAGITAAGLAGYTAVNVRGGAAVGGTGRVGSVTAVRGPGGNVVAAGRGAAFVNGQFVGGRSWTAVNGAFTNWNYFTPGWWGRYPGAWFPGQWALATTAWATATWALAGDYCGCSGEPVYYDYGQNVTYDDGTVYAGEQPLATTEQYYDQAVQIADSTADSQNEDWLPLGVFAVLKEGQTDPERVVQLAVNKDGAIRGNLQDSLTDNVVQVYGAVDKQTQRVAMHIQGNDAILVETGLYNLTNDEVPVLVHYSPDRQENRTLVRLIPPENRTQATE